MKSGSYLWCHWVHKHYKNSIEKLFHISWPSRTYVQRRSPNNLNLNPNICAGRDLGLCILLLSWKVQSLSEKLLYSLFYLQRERKWREWSGVNNIFMMVNWVVISSRSNYWLLVLVICLLCRHWQEPGQYCRNQIHAVSCIPTIRVRGLISTQSRLGTNWSYENMRSNLRIVNIVGICQFRQFFKFRCCSGINTKRLYRLADSQNRTAIVPELNVFLFGFMWTTTLIQIHEKLVEGDLEYYKIYFLLPELLTLNSE